MRICAIKGSLNPQSRSSALIDYYLTISSKREINVDLIENNCIKNFIELIKDLLNKESYSSIEILNIVDIIILISLITL